MHCDQGINLAGTVSREPGESDRAAVQRGPGLLDFRAASTFRQAQAAKEAIWVAKAKSSSRGQCTREPSLCAQGVHGDSRRTAPAPRPYTGGERTEMPARRSQESIFLPTRRHDEMSQPRKE